MSDLSDNNLKYLLRNIMEIDFSECHLWTPEIVVDNSIATQDECKYRLELVEKDPNFLANAPHANLNRFIDNLSIRVTEMRKLKAR